MIGRFAVLLSLTIAAAGCAARGPEPTPFPTTGQAPLMDQPNTSTVSSDIAGMVFSQLKPSDGPITLGGDNPMIEKNLATTLKARGYRLAMRNGKHTVSYILVPIGPALLIRLHIDSMQAAKLYRAGPAGELLSASPTSVTEG
jgi:hypothetical protein